MWFLTRDVIFKEEKKSPEKNKATAYLDLDIQSDTKNQIKKAQKQGKEKKKEQMRKSNKKYRRQVAAECYVKRARF